MSFQSFLNKVRQHRLVTFIILSFFIHLSIFVSLSLTSLKKPQVAQRQVVEIDFMSSEVVKKQAPTRLKQIIEQDERRLNEDEPDKEAYLGRHTQRVVKETRAARTGDFKNTAERGGASSQQEIQVGDKKTNQKSLRSKADQGLPSLSDLKPNLRPSHQRQFDDVSKNAGESSATNDYLKDKHVGIETMLNSREFVYYTYYQRIRSQLRQHWEPSIRSKVKKIFSEGRSIASTKDHITQVVIVLDGSGSLLKVQVIGESGVRDLDEAAVEAFRAAEPFPNPPKGMIESDGTIKIRWDFILEA